MFAVCSPSLTKARIISTRRLSCNVFLTNVGATTALHKPFNSAALMDSVWRRYVIKGSTDLTAGFLLCKDARPLISWSESTSSAEAFGNALIGSSGAKYSALNAIQ